jgi:hypothetical protein
MFIASPHLPHSVDNDLYVCCLTDCVDQFCQHFDRTMTAMMEKLPTELMREVVEYSDRPTIHSFSILSSKYREIAQPLLFRRITTSVMADERFALFIEHMQNNNKLALMIKTLIIGRTFTIESLQHLFEIVSNLEELIIQFAVASFILSSHYFPYLRRLHFPVYNPELLNDVVAKFIPCHKFLNVLSIPLASYFTSDLVLPLAESESESESAASSSNPICGSVNRLVTYNGPRDLLHFLTPNSRMKHFTSSQQLDEGTLRKLSRVASSGLLSLIIDDTRDGKALPAPLLPSLFPNLRSVAWLSVDWETTSAIDQLPHLRRIWFCSMHFHLLPENVEAFITSIMELSDKQNRPLREIHVYAPYRHPFSHTYSKTSMWSHQTGLPIKPFVS